MGVFRIFVVVITINVNPLTTSVDVVDYLRSPTRWACAWEASVFELSCLGITRIKFLLCTAMKGLNPLDIKFWTPLTRCAYGVANSVIEIVRSNLKSKFLTGIHTQCGLERIHKMGTQVHSYCNRALILWVEALA